MKRRSLATVLCVSISIAANASQFSVPSFTLTGGLPTGVTLQAIDGGSDYYCRNGFTNACNAGWDAPTFFPIGVYYGMFTSQADVDRWHDLGLNVSLRATGNSNMTLLRTGGIASVVAAEGGTLENPVGTETVGLNAYDEPSTMSQWESALQNTPNSTQDHRFWMLNNTWNFLYYGDLGGVSSSVVLSTQVTTPNGTKRSINIPSVDMYWFAGVPSGLSYQCGLMLNNGTSCPNDKVARGSNYGLLVDMLRGFVTPAGAKPVMQFVEDGGPYNEDTTAATYITPPQLNWAVWSSVIHGARMIVYFNHSFAGPAISNDNLAQAYYRQVQPGQSISIYDQVKQTNAQIASVAPIINSPTAVGYVTASPTPSNFAGIEAVAKYVNGQFYILATTRNSQSQTNIPAAFTIKSGSSVTVVGENRTLPIGNGIFRDTFATGASVHIYQIDN